MRTLNVTFISLLLLCSSACADGVYGEVALGVNITEHMPWSQGYSGGFDGGRDTIKLTLGMEKADKFIRFSHISHLSRGWPANEETEDWVDILEIGVKFKLKVVNKRRR